MNPLALTRDQIVAFRRRVSGLDARLPPGARSLRQAAWAGLQDSMPRAALLSIHARVAGTGPGTWEHPSLVQVWGPRFSVYVVARRDLAVFTLGRLPDGDTGRRKAQDLAARLQALLGDAGMLHSAAERALRLGSNQLRYAAPTGTVLMRWDGARQPTLWSVPAPDLDPASARLELARRHLHRFGPTSPVAFAAWAGIGRGEAMSAYRSLTRSLLPVRTPVGDRWLLAKDEAAIRTVGVAQDVARLLPSGDVFTLLQGEDRALLVPDAAHRDLLWTPRVWPGAVVVGGEVVGTWRRSEDRMTIAAWRGLAKAERAAVETEAASLPIAGEMQVRWED